MRRRFVSAQLSELFGEPVITIPSNRVPLMDLVLADGPAGLWPLTETSGTTANDISGNGRHGSYDAGFTLSSSGVYLTGEGSGTGMVSFPNAALGSLTGNFTIGLTVHADGTADAWNLLSVFSGTSKPIQIQCGSTSPSNQLALIVGNGASEATAVARSAATGFTAGAWHHLAFRCSGTTYTILIDGAVAASASSGQARSLGSDLLRLGRRGPSDSQRGRTGRYRDLYIVPSALSTERIAQHAAAALT